MAASEHLASLASLAEAALPTLRVPRASFEAYVEAHDAGKKLLQSAPGQDVSAGATELLLACAIAQKSAEALRIFEAQYIAPLERTLGRMRLTAPALDEVAQLVREKLLVPGADGRARVESYAGQGRLMGLVQVVATREALGLLRRTRREVLATDHDLATPVVGGVDPASAILLDRYRDAFRAAFADAALRLTSRQRNLLRMHLLGGVTLEQLATIHAVDRATIVRWLRGAREDVLAGTKAGLRAALRLRADELESVMGLVQSRLDVSIERLLMTQGDADEPDEDP